MFFMFIISLCAILLHPARRRYKEIKMIASRDIVAYWTPLKTPSIAYLILRWNLRFDLNPRWKSHAWIRRGGAKEVFLEEVGAREKEVAESSKRIDGASAWTAERYRWTSGGPVNFLFFCRTEHRHRQIDIYSRSAAIPRFPTAVGRPRALGVTDTPTAAVW